MGRGGCAEQKGAALGGAEVGAPQCLPSLPPSFSSRLPLLNPAGRSSVVTSTLNVSFSVSLISYRYPFGYLVYISVQHC